MCGLRYEEKNVDSAEALDPWKVRRAPSEAWLAPRSSPASTPGPWRWSGAGLSSPEGVGWFDDRSLYSKFLGFW